jgi:translocation protein SEC63
MANYHYDEAGNMAAYFLITFLAVILTPLTVSLSPTSSMHRYSDIVAPLTCIH